MLAGLLGRLEPLRQDLVVYVDEAAEELPDLAAQLLFRGRELRLQIGKDLGERMARAFEEVFAEGAEQALLFGADIPDLDARLLERFLRRLGRRPMVLGPAADGGYYLIGFRREAFRPEVFRDIPWGSAAVAGLTLQRAGELDLRCWRGPRLRDIDTGEDLEAFAQRSRA
jgi:rSAM/selenodomain-associated transferase 1